MTDRPPGGGGRRGGTEDYYYNSDGTGSEYSGDGSARSFYSSDEDRSRGSSRSGGSGRGSRDGRDPIEPSWWENVLNDCGCGQMWDTTALKNNNGDDGGGIRGGRGKRYNDSELDSEAEREREGRIIDGYDEIGKRVTEDDILKELMGESIPSRSSDASMYDSENEGGGGGRLGPDGVRLKMKMPSGAGGGGDDTSPRDGEEFPNISTVKREFKRMLKSLKKGNNNDRAMEEQKLHDQQALLEEALRNPTVLYKMARVLDSTYMHMFIYLCIFVVAIVSGLETDKNYASHPAIEPIGLTVSIIFAVECLLKIVTAGVEVQTEDGKMHLVKSDPKLFFYDFMNCLDFFIVIISFSDYYADFEGGSSLMVLRVLRLARVLKVITVIPELQVILSGVAEGCKSIGWILLLLSAVVYIYSILGVMLFRLNDPRNFRNLGVAIATVLNISTADFLDYFFINYLGCDKYGYDDDMAHCTNPIAAPITAPVYFISLVLIVGQIMMSLFIGVVTNKMEEAAVHLRETKLERHRAAKAMKSGSIFATRESAEAAFGPSMYYKIWTTLNIISGKETGEEDVMDVKEVTFASISNPLKKLQYLVNLLITHPGFEIFVVCAILVAGIETGIETSHNIEEELPPGLHVIGMIVLCIFVAELVLKIFVVIDRPWKFFKGEQGKWNVFDLLVVIFAFVPSKVEGLATVIRLARLLRLLKLIRAVPQLQVIIFSLMQGMASIFYVAVLMALTFYIYGIAGVHLFGENDPFHFKNLGTAFVTLFRMSMMEDWKPVVDIAVSGCGRDAYNQADGGAMYADITGSDLADLLCVQSKGHGFIAMFYFFTFVLFSALVLVSVFVGIIVTGMQDATEQMKTEEEMQRRAKMTGKYFDLNAKDVSDVNELFRVLDVDGSEELMIGELHEVMEGLQVTLSKSFLRKVVDVFAKDKDELDEADFLLLVMLCKRAIAIEQGVLDENGLASPSPNRGRVEGGILRESESLMNSEDERQLTRDMGMNKESKKMEGYKQMAEERERMSKSISRLQRKMSSLGGGGSSKKQ